MCPARGAITRTLTTRVKTIAEHSSLSYISQLKSTEDHLTNAQRHFKSIYIVFLYNKGSAMASREGVRVIYPWSLHPVAQIFPKGKCLIDPPLNLG